MVSPIPLDSYFSGIVVEVFLGIGSRTVIIITGYTAALIANNVNFVKKLPINGFYDQKVAKAHIEILTKSKCKETLEGLCSRKLWNPLFKHLKLLEKRNYKL